MVTKLRVLIAEDSGFMQLLIQNILKTDESIEVIGRVSNGKDAFEFTQKNNPDVVIMDIQMPEYDGLYGVREIMTHCPTPIVVLSALGYTNINPIMESLKLGAFDYLNKPQGDIKLKVIDSEIIRKVKLAARVGVRKVVDLSRIPIRPQVKTFCGESNYECLVIGSSTGGPTAVEKLITRLPMNLPLAVLVVQHMPPNFIYSFTQRLDSLVPFPVKVGHPGTIVRKGEIYVAISESNTTLVRDKEGNVVIQVSEQSYPEYNYPSINSMMYATASLYENKAIGVILTGMGRDGANGLREIRNRGGYSIAQDQETSVVFGMPKEAIENGGAQDVVSIDSMGEHIISILSRN